MGSSMLGVLIRSCMQLEKKLSENNQIGQVPISKKMDLHVHDEYLLECANMNSNHFVQIRNQPSPQYMCNTASNRGGGISSSPPFQEPYVQFSLHTARARRYLFERRQYDCTGLPFNCMMQAEDSVIPSDMITLGQVHSSSLMLRLASHHLAAFIFGVPGG